MIFIDDDVVSLRSRNEKLQLGDHWEAGHSPGTEGGFLLIDDGVVRGSWIAEREVFEESLEKIIEYIKEN